MKPTFLNQSRPLITCMIQATNPTDAIAMIRNAAFDGCSTQSEPSLTVLSSLANIIRENGLNAVLTVEFSSASVADWLARETGTRVLALHSCHSLTQEEFKRGETYLSLMEKNLEALTEAMK